MTVPDAPVHYDVTPEALIRALASHPLTENLVPWARERMAGKLLAQMPAMPADHVMVSRDLLAGALTRLDVRVLTSGPAAGMINAESMAGAILEALAGVSP